MSGPSASHPLDSSGTLAPRKVRLFVTWPLRIKKTFLSIILNHILVQKSFFSKLIFSDVPSLSVFHFYLKFFCCRRNRDQIGRNLLSRHLPSDISSLLNLQDLHLWSLLGRPLVNSSPASTIGLVQRRSSSPTVHGQPDLPLFQLPSWGSARTLGRTRPVLERAWSRLAIPSKGNSWPGPGLAPKLNMKNWLRLGSNS